MILKPQNPDPFQIALALLRRVLESLRQPLLLGGAPRDLPLLLDVRDLRLEARARVADVLSRLRLADREVHQAQQGQERFEPREVGVRNLGRRSKQTFSESVGRSGHKHKVCSAYWQASQCSGFSKEQASASAGVKVWVSDDFDSP